METERDLLELVVKAGWITVTSSTRKKWSTELGLIFLFGREILLLFSNRFNDDDAVSYCCSSKIVTERINIIKTPKSLARWGYRHWFVQSCNFQTIGQLGGMLILITIWQCSCEWMECCQQSLDLLRFRWGISLDDSTHRTLVSWNGHHITKFNRIWIRSCTMRCARHFGRWWNSKQLKPTGTERVPRCAGEPARRLTEESRPKPGLYQEFSATRFYNTQVPKTPGPAAAAAPGKLGGKAKNIGRGKNAVPSERGEKIQKNVFLVARWCSRHPSGKSLQLTPIFGSRLLFFQCPSGERLRQLLPVFRAWLRSKKKVYQSSH